MRPFGVGSVLSCAISSSGLRGTKARCPICTGSFKIVAKPNTPQALKAAKVKRYSPQEEPLDERQQPPALRLSWRASGLVEPMPLGACFVHLTEADPAPYL